MRPHPRYSAAECSEAARDYPSTPSPSSNQRQNQAKLHRLQKRNSQSEFSALRQLLRATSVLHIRSNTPLLATYYPCSFVTSVGNIFLPRISQIFTDLVTCYPCSFVLSVRNVLFSHGFHRFSQIWLHVIRVHLWHQWEYFFSHGFHRFSQIWLHVIRVHLCHQWEMFFSPTDFHRFSQIWLHVIRAHLCHQ